MKTNRIVVILAFITFLVLTGCTGDDSNGSTVVEGDSYVPKGLDLYHSKIQLLGLHKATSRLMDRQGLYCGTEWALSKGNIGEFYSIGGENRLRFETVTDVLRPNHAVTGECYLSGAFKITNINDNGDYVLVNMGATHYDVGLITYEQHLQDGYAFQGSVWLDHLESEYSHLLF